MAAGELHKKIHNLVINEKPNTGGFIPYTELLIQYQAE